MDTWKRFGEKEVSHSMAHYLQTVAALKARKGFVRVGDIADVLGVSKSGVTSMLRSLASRGFVDHERYGCVELTDAGRRLAERTESARRLLAVFLTEILGVTELTAAEDACMIEHLVSPEVMLELLRLTSFVRSQDPAAVAFLAAFRRGPEACLHQPEQSCEVCGPTCLGGALAGESRAGGASA